MMGDPVVETSKQTLYQILGVTVDASPAAIEAAYVAACAAMHDAVDFDRNRQVVLQEAYNCLRDPQRRRAYDAACKAKAAGRGMPAQRRGQRSLTWLWLLPLVLLAWWAAGYHQRAGVVAMKGLSAPAPVSPAPLPAALPVPSAPLHLSPEELYGRLTPSVAVVTILDAHGNSLGSGSGVIVAPGRVISNCHVAKSGASLSVQTLAGDFPAHLETADDRDDLCRLQVSEDAGPAVPIRASDDLRVGETVYALGAPSGLALSWSAGVISALRHAPGDGRVIQTTAAISPGSSGGGLFDTQGRLIGITTYRLAQTSNINFAVAADLITGMQERDAGLGSVGALTLGSDEKLLGAWSCFDPVGGQSWDMNFAANGHLLMQVGSRRGLVAYHRQDGRISFQVPGRRLDGYIEEISADKLVIRYGEQHFACTRQ